MKKLLVGLAVMLTLVSCGKEEEGAMAPAVAASVSTEQAIADFINGDAPAFYTAADGTDFAAPNGFYELQGQSADASEKFGVVVRDEGLLFVQATEPVAPAVIWDVKVLRVEIANLDGNINGLGSSFDLFARNEEGRMLDSSNNEISILDQFAYKVTNGFVVKIDGIPANLETEPMGNTVIEFENLGLSWSSAVEASNINIDFVEDMGDL